MRVLRYPLNYAPSIKSSMELGLYGVTGCFPRGTNGIAFLSQNRRVK